jgi:hypothetical protein
MTKTKILKKISLYIFTLIFTFCSLITPTAIPATAIFNIVIDGDADDEYNEIIIDSLLDIEHDLLMGYDIDKTDGNIQSIQSTDNNVTITYTSTGHISGELPEGHNGNTPYYIIAGRHNLRRIGHRFDGWISSSSGSTWQPGQSVRILGTLDRTFDAVWVSVPHIIITYTSTGHTAGELPVGHIVNTPDSIIVREHNLEKTGYRFDGWLSSSSNRTFQPGQSVNVSGVNSRTYDAVWVSVASAATVNYCGNNNTGGTVPSRHSFSRTPATVTLKPPGTMTKSNHTFGGWRRDNEIFQPNTIVTISQSGTYFFNAVWIPTSSRAYWCTTDKRTGCSHCVNHELISPATVTPQYCDEPSGKVYICVEIGCNNHQFYDFAPGEHNFDSQITIPSTCTTPEIIRYTCSKCPYIHEQKISPRLGHQVTSQSSSPPTCVTPGIIRVICIRGNCSYTKDEEYAPALGHDYIIHETIPSTCVTPGTVQIICTNCSDIQENEFAPPSDHYHHPLYNVCMNGTYCGHMKYATSDMFQHYMYRRKSFSPTGAFANYISADHSDIQGGNYMANHGIDITTDTRDEDGVGHIRDMPIYAQGPGRVLLSGGSANATTGFLVVIKYDNGYTARYLHLLENPGFEIGHPVDSTETIGITSNTGFIPGVTIGNHLHFDVNTGELSCGEVIKNNPRYVIRALTVFPDETFRR